MYKIYILNNLYLYLHLHLLYLVLLWIKSIKNYQVKDFINIQPIQYNYHNKQLLIMI